MNEEKKVMKMLSANKIEQLISKAISDECRKSHAVSIEGIKFLEKSERTSTRRAKMQIEISWSGYSFMDTAI